MLCPNCGREVETVAAADACPQCAQWAKVARLRRSNAILKAGVAGFAAGLAVLTWVMNASDDPSPWWVVLPLATAALGALVSGLRNRSN